MSSDFMKHIKKQLGEDLYTKSVPIMRWDSGIYKLNSALGGGFPACQISELVGKESTGKCLSKDTYVLTGDGYKLLSDIFEENNVEMLDDEVEVEKSVELVNKDGKLEKTTHFLCNGIRTVYEVTTKSGFVSKSTANHPLMILRDGFLVWKNTAELLEGDYVVNFKQPNVFGKGKLTSEEAYLLGLITADGSVRRHGISITNDDEDVKEFIRSGDVSKLLGRSCREYVKNNPDSINFCFNTLTGIDAYCEKYGIGRGVAKDKDVPKCIMSACRQTILDYLCGYLDSESYTDGRCLEVCSASYKLLYKTKLLLSQLGVKSSIRDKYAKNYPDNNYWRLTISGKDYQYFMEECLLPNSISEKVKNRYEKGRRFRDEDSLPGLQDTILQYYSQSKGRSRETYRLLSGIKKGYNISVETLNKILEILPKTEANDFLYLHLKSLQDYTFDKIVSIREMPAEPTFDFTMEESSSFIANGIINHNSTLAAKLAGVVSSTDYETGQRCEHKEGNCKVLYIDQEGTLDPLFCEGHNYYPEAYGNEILATKTGNQAIDVINAAISSCEFSLIVLDSLEALIPHRDLDKSSEDAVMGTKAKMNNDAFRRWTVSLMEARHKKALWWQRPTLLVINQLRDAIGTVPMPAQIPGGIGQKQAASIIIQLNQPKYANDGKLASKVEIKGVVKKNKTYTPRAEISFEMALRDLPEDSLKKGQVDNISSVLQDIRKYNMWEKKEDGLWHLFEFSAEKQSDFRQMMIDDKQTEIAITKHVIEWLKA